MEKWRVWTNRITWTFPWKLYSKYRWLCLKLLYGDSVWSASQHQNLSMFGQLHNVKIYQCLVSSTTSKYTSVWSAPQRQNISVIGQHHNVKIYQWLVSTTTSKYVSVWSAPQRQNISVFGQLHNVKIYQCLVSSTTSNVRIYQTISWFIEINFSI